MCSNTSILIGFVLGSRGPDMIMLDDSKAEERAVNAVYPATKSLLCTFHVLQGLTIVIRPYMLCIGLKVYPHREGGERCTLKLPSSIS